MRVKHCRHCIIGQLVVLCAVLALRPAYAASPSDPSRDASVINAFQVMCDLTAPNFEGISARATAMHMQTQDAQPPSTDGNVRTEHKAWLGRLATGPFGLLLDRLSGPKGTSTSCAVFGSVADPDIFRNELVKEMKLQAASSPEVANGARSFEWRNRSGAGTTRILRDFTPSGKPGVMVKILSMVANSTQR